jgi:hypothetical protein
MLRRSAVHKHDNLTLHNFTDIAFCYFYAPFEETGVYRFANVGWYVRPKTTWFLLII